MKLIDLFSLLQLVRLMAINSRLEQKLDSCLQTQKFLMVLVSILMAFSFSTMYLIWTSSYSADPS